MASRSLAALMTFLGVLSGPACSAAAGDAVAGRAYFRAECTLCHSAEAGDQGGGQGPGLQDLFGRKAGGQTNYTAYSAALRDSGIVWDADSLQRFLAEPTRVVPGTSMVIAVDSAADRANLAAYFAALRDRGMAGTGAAMGGAAAGRLAEGNAGQAASRGSDWRSDAPGKVHRVDIGTLPAPFHSPSALNLPRVVAKPKDAKLSVPPGFRVEVFLEGLSGPRSMLVAPNGDVILAETRAGRLKVLRPTPNGRTAFSYVFAKGLQQPYGLAFHPSSGTPRWLYVAELNRVVRYRYEQGMTEASGEPEVVIPQLSPTAGGHFTRDIAFSADDKRLYVAIGSLSNVAEKMGSKPMAEALAWDARHGLGAAWGNEENRAMVRVHELEGDTLGRTFATGLRNCVGMVVQPGTGDLWCTVNERDALGDDLVPDYATRVREGAFYGWPWYYMGNREDPRRAGERPDLAGKVTDPDVPFTAHSAATNIKFYTAREGRSLFPPAYRDLAFVVLHGSWNRRERTGHKVVTLPMHDGQPTGEYVDFLTGFITPEGNAWGRPVAIAVARDGSLLLADDGANLIYRISYGE